MNCKHVNNLLSQYAAHDLPAHIQAQVQSHLNGDARQRPCAICAAHLTMLQSALALLQADAQTGLGNTPDLYAAFRQRLVTQPQRRGPFAALPARFSYLPRLGVIALGVCAVASGRYYRQHRYDSTLNFAIDAMRRPVDNVHFEQDTDSVDPDGNISSNAYEYWIQNGYTCSKIIYQNGSRPPQQPAKASDFIRSFQYILPCGVEFYWQQQPARQRSVILSWFPILPEHPGGDIVNQILRETQTKIERLENTGDVQAAGIHTKRGAGFLQQCLEFQIDHYRQAVPHDPAIISDNPPETMSLWLDRQNRLQRYQEQVIYKGGTHTTQDRRYEYGQHIPYNVYNRSLGVPVLPARMKVVVSDTIWDNNKGQVAYRAVDPVWLTMSDGDKRQIQEAVTRWAHAWSSGDANRLRGVVDVNWPLEVTRPDKRGGMTTEDVWRQIWADRMAKEAHYHTFAVQMVFAYQAPRWAVEQPVTDFTTRSGDRPLPGLNALCWIRARQADGTKSVFPARLFLVKRQEGYKVFQYCRLTPPLSARPDDEP